MANLSDVLDELVSLISTILYPNGEDQPSIVDPAVSNIYVYAGWPRPFNLENDAKQNNTHVSIFPQNNGRNTTRFQQAWHQNSISPPTITLALNNNQLTIGGTISTPQAVMVIVNNIGYAHQIEETDTLEDIAAALAGLIPNSSAAGNVLTINAAFSIVPRVTTYGEGIKEIKRQETIINIIIWSNSRVNRTLVSDPIEIGLGKLTNFVLTKDNYYAPILYVGIKDHDELQKSVPIYRRDLMFKVEYPTVVKDTFPTITQTIQNIEVVDQLP